MLLGSIVVMFSALQIIIYDVVGNVRQNNIFEFNGLDINIIQKILLCFFVVSILNKISFIKDRYNIFNKLADASFSIYFLHYFVIKLIDYYIGLGYFNFIPGAILFLMKSLVVIIIVMLVANFIRFIFGSKSRYIIGW